MNNILIVKNLKLSGKNRIQSIDVSQLHTDIMNCVSSPEWYEEIYHKCKPYFDIDYPPKNINLSYQEYLQSNDDFDKLVLEDFVNECITIFNTSSDHICISKGQVHKEDSRYKCSYHIVINGIQTTKEDLKRLVKQIDKKYYLDPAPYSNNGKQQIFRLPLCSKNNERKLLLLNGEFYQHLITNLKGDEKIYSFQEKDDKPQKIKTHKIPNIKNKISYELLEKVVCGLSSYRAFEYKDWLYVIFAILRVSYENNYIQKGNMLCHSFSKQSSNYDSDQVNERIRYIQYTEEGYNFSTLKKYLYMDNKKIYYDIFGDISHTYEEMKKEFEISNFKIMNPIMYVNIFENELYFNSQDKFCQKYRNLWCNVYDIKTSEYKKIQFIHKWMDDCNIKTYEKLDFLPPPLKCPCYIYNLFDGFNAERLPPLNEVDNIQLLTKDILEHIYYICGKENHTYTYFIKWLAHIIQQPGELSRTAPIIKSVQGCGKNILLDFIGQKILGDKYFYSSSRTEDFFGRFNTVLKNKLLLNLNETSGKDTFDVNEKIKSQITDITIPIEEKGVNTITLRNCGRYVFTTNNENSIRIQPKERRLFCMESSSEHKSDYNYFVNLKKKMNDTKVIRGFYEYLKTIDIKYFDFENERPKTDLYMSMSSINIPMIGRFLSDYIDDMENEEEIIFSKDLYDNYNEWKVGIGYKEEGMNVIKFGTKLVSIYKINKPQERSSKGARYIINKKRCKETLKILGYIEENIDKHSIYKEINVPKIL